MQKKAAPKKDTVNQKQNDFDAAFEKFSKKLPKDYTDQFKKPEQKATSKNTQIKEAMKYGKKIEIVSKNTGNKAHAPNLNIPKILDDEHVLEIKTVPKEIASQVAKVRAEKKLTQDQLATKISEKASVIKDLENCEGVYDPKVVEKIEKVLSVKFDRPWKK
jgi:putative transcription factor